LHHLPRRLLRSAAVVTSHAADEADEDLNEAAEGPARVIHKWKSPGKNEQVKQLPRQREGHGKGRRAKCWISLARFYLEIFTFWIIRAGPSAASLRSLSASLAGCGVTTAADLLVGEGGGAS
jgi:hypothetical protein